MALTVCAPGLRSVPAFGWRFSVPSRPFCEAAPAFFALNSAGRRHELLVGYLAGDAERAATLVPSVLRRIARRSALSPGERLADCRAYLSPLLGAEMFCSAWCGIFHEDGTVLSSNAGHPPPHLRRRSAPSLALPPGGVPFGLEQSLISPERVFRMRAGDHLLVRADDLLAVWVERESA